MEKAYHPCYTKLNPVIEAQKYTSVEVRYRKATLVYDWLDAKRDVESWFRRVPYRLEEGDKEGSWVVKYFEFLAEISPMPQAGFIGDLWISWDARDPSVWFKVDETKWERWGGCASSARNQTNARHPFLDNAYLWFDPKDYFFLNIQPGGKPRLQWVRRSRIRRVLPISRIIDPDCSSPPRKAPANPIRLPSMRTIVHSIWPHIPRNTPVARRRPITPVADREEGCSSGRAVGTGTVKVEGPQGPFPMEEISLGSNDEFDWNWWGDTDGEAMDETTEVGGSQPQRLSLTPTATPVTSANSSRYHPYRPNSSPASPTKFKPPQRYAQGLLGPGASSRNLFNTPVSSFVSSTSTAVNPTGSLVTADDKESVDLPEEEIPPQHETACLQKPSHRTLQGIARILKEAGHDQSGTWAVLLPEAYDVREGLEAELPVPILDLGIQTSYKIRDLLEKDGFVQHGILLLNTE